MIPAADKCEDRELMMRLKMSIRLIGLLLLCTAMAARAGECHHEEGKSVQPSAAADRHLDAAKEHAHECEDEEWDIPELAARQVNPVMASATSLSAGEKLYSANCQRCHGDAGLGDGPDAGKLADPPANLQYASRHHNDGELFFMISTGRDPMPAWKDRMTADERWSVINYIRFSLGADHTPGDIADRQ